MWENYKNLNHNSSITKFMIYNDEIAVQFFNGKKYYYRASDIGNKNLDKMISLAKNGSGLGNLIKTNSTISSGYYKKTL